MRLSAGEARLVCEIARVREKSATKASLTPARMRNPKKADVST
jgi:hypothetical protein